MDVLLLDKRLIIATVCLRAIERRLTRLFYVSGINRCKRLRNALNKREEVFTLHDYFQHDRSVKEAATRCCKIVRLLMRTKRTNEQNFKLAEDLATAFINKFGTISERTSEYLSMLALANDTTGGMVGTEKYAKCSNFEYSFYSFKKYRRSTSATERYAKEFPTELAYLSILLAFNPEEDFCKGIFTTTTLIEGISSDELFILKEHFIKGNSCRDMEKLYGASKSTWARKISLFENILKERLGGYYE